MKVNLKWYWLIGLLAIISLGIFLLACQAKPQAKPADDQLQQWEKSGHSGIVSTTTPERATSSSCARCHSEQGFLLWQKQGDLTKQIQGAKGNATADEMKALGFTADKLKPITCVVCHTEGTATRIVGGTAKLPAGFQAKVVGKGALCITCHNTRNDVHNVDAPPTSYSAPHTAAQADVVMGENAYFVAVGQRSPHSYVQDTCVTCHMEKTPPPEGYKSATNHTFKASLKVCGECHSPTLSGAALQAGTEEKVEELMDAMSQYMLKKIPAQITIKDYTPHVVGGKSYDILSDAIVIAKDSIASLEPTEPHGQQGFIIKFKSPVNVSYSPVGESPHSVSLTEAEVRLGDITTDGKTAVIAITDPLVQAGWNFFLIEGDGSFGIHNPSFTFEVLEASIEALK